MRVINEMTNNKKFQVQSIWPDFQLLNIFLQQVMEIDAIKQCVDNIKY